MSEDRDTRIEEEAIRSAAIAIMEALPDASLEELRTHLASDSDDDLETFLAKHVPHYEHVITRALTPLAEELRRLAHH